ncbi:hypothetical protein V4D30_03075 [Thermodesulfovibrio sp. 3907-1M]|uniref:DUF3782 domain-containing protein n=1 Tax=Thermodesulfovibrio autotrophicus TaxID=3118333 RepID=A0AAU8GXJ3_9BACT
MQAIEKDIEKEMREYPILTFADILQALKSHPEWLEELRKIILTTELLELPKKFDDLLKRVDKIEKDVEILKQDVAVLKQDVAVLKQDVAVLKQDVAVLKQDVAVLKKDMAYLKGEFGRFKGKDFERTIKERYFSFFGRILRKSKLVQFEEVVPILDDAEERGLITEEQRDSVLNLDLLVKGQIKSTHKSVILAVEVSYSLHEDDIQRAIERAQILAQVLHEEVIPTVVTAEAKEDLEKLADEKGVFIIKADY